MTPAEFQEYETLAIKVFKHEAFEREFFSLAKWMLGCRLRCMGGDVIGLKIPVGDLAFSLLGYVDHAGEMELLCAEVLSR